ncbi:HEPN domain-containing protein [Thermus antranikianii]|uniref:HEPN domain-containing protein n=1 Tax=Thermus antranikianii TaxID=88190 RepID=A0ABY7RSB9_9DEIN|nr:HEPN domain-containing protein [Thermus antranikianii]QWK20871.1 MAG: HEPN domain-containing protein [Thermus antranikianii]WCM40231.1 HEPN domain-containing protein [Thermus antranikianii]
MPREASDPWTWLTRAKSNLARARLGRTSPEVAWEDPCFDAQQAAEKALKALLIALGIPFPKTHDLARLLELIRPHLPVPVELEALARLNPFAVAGRYPGDLPEATEEDWKEALLLAEQAVAWAERVLAGD